MTKEQFLTVRWNNLLSFSLGLIPLFYVIATLTTSVLDAGAAFAGMAVIGVVY